MQIERVELLLIQFQMAGSSLAERFLYRLDYDCRLVGSRMCVGIQREEERLVTVTL